jgi:hydrogenase maturation protein HypF
VARMATSPAWPRATGAGRLLEAGGALLGLVADNTWEGEAAARLEALAGRAGEVPPWPEVRLEPGSRVLPSAALLAAAAWRVIAGEDPAAVAAGLHRTFCRLAVDLTILVADRPGQAVALGGGCMVNRLLLRWLTGGLREAGLEPLVPRQLPPGDGGLAYGQAVVAVVALARGVEPRQVGG